MAYCESILDAIGRTPLVRLRRIEEGLGVTLLAKVESLNPGGSVKDRPALAMLEDAEKRGLIGPGGAIVEATAGNTGVGLAVAAASRGYRCIFVMPDKMSAEKMRLLEAYGAEVVVTATDVAPDSPLSYNGVANRLAGEIPGAWRPNQFENLINPQAHYSSTGPEIWDDADGRLDAFVAGVGTGGTLSGVSRFLKEQDPRILTIGADPEGSILAGGDAAGSWKVEGIGEDFVPATFEPTLVDAWVTVSDAESFAMARRLAREEGILAGGSSGTALAAAVRYAPLLPKSAVVAVLLPDTGRNYLSKVFCTEWLEEHGLTTPVDKGARVIEVLTAKRHMPPLISVKPTNLASDAARMLQAYSISQVPVTDNGRIIGSLDEGRLMHLLREGTDLATTTVEDVMAAPLPTVADEADVGQVYRLLEAGHPGVVVTRDGMALGFLDRSDLIAFWSKSHESKAAVA